MSGREIAMRRAMMMEDHVGERPAVRKSDIVIVAVSDVLVFSRCCGGR